MFAVCGMTQALGSGIILSQSRGGLGPLHRKRRDVIISQFELGNWRWVYLSEGLRFSNDPGRISCSTRKNLSLMGFWKLYLPEIATATQLRNLVEVSQENMRASLLPMESESLSKMTKSEEIITSPLTYNSGLSS